MEAQLYINEIQCDVKTSDLIKVVASFSIADIKKVAASHNRSSGVTDTLKIPATKTNRAALGFPEDESSDNAVWQNVRTTARIEVNGIGVIDGIVQVKKAFEGFGLQIGSYDIVVIGDNGDWKNDIKEDTLSDLDFSDYEHVYTSANITASETAASFYNYGLINYGEFRTISSVNVEDRRPLVNAAMIIKKIFNTKGYSVVSTFLNSTWFAKLYHSLLDRDFKHTDAWKENREINAGMSIDQVIPTPTNFPNYFTETVEFDDDSTDPFFDNGSNFNTSTYKYTADEPTLSNWLFNYKIDVALDGAAVVGAGWLTIWVRLMKGTNLIVSKKHVVLSPYIASQFNATNNITGVLESGDIKLLGGETLLVDLKIQNFSTSDLTVTIDKDETTFSNNVNTVLLGGSTIDFSALLSDDITQLEYLQEFKENFNLMFLTDVTERKVYIEPYDDFYNSTVVDWTKKVDLSGGKAVTVIQNPKKQVYAWVNDSNDKYIEKLNEDLRDDYGTITKEYSNIFAENTAKLDTKLFAPTAMATCDAIGLQQSRIPTMLNDVKDYPIQPKQSFDFKMRLLYFAGVVNCENWTFVTTVRTDYPYFYFMDEESNFNYGLQFDDIERSNGLFERYYRNSFNNQNTAKLSTFKMKLSLTEISGLDFRKLYLINDRYYRLNKVDGWIIETGECSVELMTAERGVAISDRRKRFSAKKTISFQTIARNHTSDMLLWTENAAGEIVAVHTGNEYEEITQLKSNSGN